MFLNLLIVIERQRHSGGRGWGREEVIVTHVLSFWSFKTPRRAGESLLAFQNEEACDGEPTQQLGSNEVPSRPLALRFPLQ